MHPAWSKISSFYCLNLDTNPARWTASQEQFAKVGLDVEQVICIESKDNRYLSFNQSHYDTVKRGHATGQPFGIFEDDIKFTEHWKYVEEGMNELPEDWELLYLGCNFMGDWKMPVRYTNRVARLYNAWQTHAIIYSEKGAERVLKNFDPLTFPVYDEWLRVNVMPTQPVFVLNPMICYQRPGYSDIWQNNVDYTGVHIDGNKWMKSNI